MTTELPLVDTAPPNGAFCGPPSTAASPASGRRRPLLTPRRSNVLFALLLCLVLPTVTARAMPRLLTQADCLILAEAVAFAVAALSLNLLTGYAGQISLGHAGLLGAGAFASGLLTSRLGLPMWLGVPGAAAATALVALVIGFPALRLRGLYLAMVTFAFGFAMYTGVLRLEQLTGGSAGIELPRRLFRSRMLDDYGDLLATALVVLLLAWLLDANVARTRLGRAFRAIRENEAVAQSFGIDVAHYKLTAFVLSGALAGTAGAMWGHAVGFVNSESFFTPTDLSLSLLIVVVVGGLGHRTGAVVSAVFFSLFPYLLEGLHVPHVRGSEVMVGAALLMYTVARHPEGFAGIARDRRRRREATQHSGNDQEVETRLPAWPWLERRRTALFSDATEVPVLDVRDVTVRFGGLVAVDSVQLQVPRGRIVGLIGPNGAGKTTLFNTICGLIPPAQGRVFVNGRDVSRLPAHRRAALGLARTFQQIGLAKDQTVLDNLLLAQHLLAGYGDGRALLYTPTVARVERELEDRARRTLAALGIADRETLPLRLLSHGQQRIVEVGCALLTDPEVLLLDEPSAGLSPAAVATLADRLRQLRDDAGRTVLLIEHNVPLVLDVCDYVYVLNYGRVLAQGTPDDIVAHPDVVGAYLGEVVA